MTLGGDLLSYGDDIIGKTIYKLSGAIGEVGIKSRDFLLAICFAGPFRKPAIHDARMNNLSGIAKGKIEKIR